MKWCKGKFYTEDQDKLLRATSAKRREGGKLPLLWSLRGQNITLENRTLETMRCWPRSIVWIKRGGC